MIVDFFNTACSEELMTDVKFGLCDDQNSTKAYSNTTDPSKWIAVVTNSKGISVQFTPIDNCIKVYKSGTSNLESSCDGMMTFANSIFLVELKNTRTKGWIPDAIAQLKSTISIMSNNTDLNGFRFKTAFVCNKKHRRFTVIESEQNKRFYDETRFRIDIQADINIS